VTASLLGVSAKKVLIKGTVEVQDDMNDKTEC
jgi:hypothetical protein